MNKNKRVESIQRNLEYAIAYNVLPHGWINSIRDLINYYDALNQENEDLKEVIRFYAFEDNYKQIKNPFEDTGFEKSVIDLDRGKEARLIIEKWKGDQES